MTPLAGGAVSDRVERVTVHFRRADGRVGEIAVVRKLAWVHEVAGLRAAQAVRPGATAVPELIADGVDATGPWLICAMCPGLPLAGRDAAIPANLFDSLARLHAHFRHAIGEPAGVPLVDAEWWARLCASWVLPGIERHGGRHLARATALVTAVADDARVRRALDRLTPTLLHGDVHPGNVIVHGGRAGLVDWGSSRRATAMLDLANLVDAGSEGFREYERSWRLVTGEPLDARQVDLGYRWAALQMPVQYLPWMLEHRPDADIDAALDRAERALRALDE